MIRLGFVLVLGLLSVRLWSAAEAGQPGGYLRAGLGARAAALGDAMVAAVEGPDAGYWNPAALALARRPALSSGLSLLSLGRQFNTAALQIAWDPSGGSAPGTFSAAQRVGLGGWAVTWLGFSLGDDFEGRRNDTASFYRFSDRQSAYLLSHGRPLASWLALGVGLKLYDRALETFSASGTGLDLGALILLGPRWRLGVAGADLFSQLRWSTGYAEKLPSVLRSSLSARVWPRVQLMVQTTAVEGRSLDPGAGIELEPFSNFFARLGWKKEGLGAGAGLRLPLKAWHLTLDYAYLPDPLQQGEAQRIELHLYF